MEGGRRKGGKVRGRGRRARGRGREEEVEEDSTFVKSVDPQRPVLKMNSTSSSLFKLVFWRLKANSFPVDFSSKTFSRSSSGTE